MKKLLTTSHNLKSIDGIILLMRISIAALMLSHGIPKMFHLFSGDPVQFPPVMGLSPEMSLGLAVFAEVFCSILILVGFATRLATVPLMITMLIAVFVIHAADPFAKQELGLFYLLVYVLLFITGSGKYSIDQLLSDRQLSPSVAGSVRSLQANR